jgi:uncharacterized membrane protein YczE
VIYWMSFFRPHKTVPMTPWTGSHPWDLAPVRVVILSFGLFIFGLGDSLVIQSTLGNAPWSVLAQGLSGQLNISIGSATLLVSAVVLALWLPLRERPGFGTIMNILIIAGAIDIGIWLFPSPTEFPWQFAYVLFGIAMVGAGSALYITCGLGPGPRDGWMTALHKRTGVRVGRVRLAIELAVLTLGWFLGGTVGLGTALFALFIGHSVAISFGVVSRLTTR